MNEQRAPKNLQDNFLNRVRKEEKNIRVLLVSGDSIKGKVIGFDNFVLILQTEKNDVLVYKHSISAVFPEEKFKLF